MRLYSNTALILARVWRALRVPVISLFILFHTCALVLWISAPFPLYWSMVSVIRPYVCYFGFWNQWQMFAHPKAFNIHLTTNVTLADGKVVNWDFPRMEKLDLVTRAFKGRFRGWAHEYVNEERNPLVRPEACKFIARSVNDGVNPPTRVQLVRHWTWIQPPPGMGDARPQGEFAYMFYTYDVSPEDLR